MTIRDLYTLTTSAPFSLESSDAEDISLLLTKVPPSLHTHISGKVVTAADGEPIEGATIKVFSSDLEPLYHTLTDAEGNYSFTNVIPPGTYKIAAVAENYLLSEIKNLSIRKRVPLSDNFKLPSNPLALYGIIYGKIVDHETGMPLSYCTVVLLNTDGTTYAETTTNEDGEYLLYHVPPGQYEIVAKAADYYNSGPLSVDLQLNDRIKANVGLKTAAMANTGAISGVIQIDNSPASSIPVFLFRKEGEEEKIVQVQMTQEDGLYLFGAVERGEYVVRAKLQEGGVYIEVLSVT
ncbi:carboxypeptidase regulatory-like domain-containing protein [Paenibacillus apiarius]|uniref:Carboxypeptidase regulatory-like domain-containing protein n=1 Tax=Paenibacillus apiarius TaxID=46240 RepID=A0ABT4DQ32_9BACL|nr:carboxypeptidase regulatory-like domain-containing protein [Paenibacillus apiarius]MCY9513939.1 carboxypeptidase regulatory-like domain-containing protein [Paenibacillus apiarius]MCY9519456.1 carboxypeptidase regulatory-like domain-containing protein [Paenibacillus apiarius]MCY9552383.1 carboxypeptidase regulatory-like domain-containing protein [Paenibacillus apiarius]MCY9556211.1 carboxypeptidase regulatory-like domain-containing protein [Paenibacillus apiarius]MCY9681746.1 carboxypeptidas